MSDEKICRHPDYELLCWLVSEADRHEQLYAHQRGDRVAEAFHSVNATMCRKAAERINELLHTLEVARQAIRHLDDSIYYWSGHVPKYLMEDKGLEYEEDRAKASNALKAINEILGEK